VDLHLAFHGAIINKVKVEVKKNIALSYQALGHVGIGKRSGGFVPRVPSCYDGIDKIITIHFKSSSIGWPII